MANTGAAIILVRHGETDLNSGTERIRGWADVPLNQEGQQQADYLGKVLQRAQPAVIYSSDLGRAMETARRIQRTAPDASIVPLDGLRPWDVGNFTGQPVEEIKGALVDLLKSRTKPAPGGEAYADFVNRFVSTFGEVAAHTRKLGEPVVVVTHSRGTRLVHELVTKGAQSLMTPEASDVLLRREDPIPPGGYVVLPWDGSKWRWPNGQASQG